MSTASSPHPPTPRAHHQAGDVPAIHATGLRRDFGSLRAVDDLDLDIAAGSVYGLLGPNGAGKSTVVKLLTTLLRPSSGSATIMGHDLAHAPHRVRSVIGVAGQYASVDETLTGRENLRLFARLTGMSRTDSRRRADELLEAFSLADAAGRRVGRYSGGMRRRLDLAVSMVATPPLLFLDEPTTGLDPRTRQQMWQVVEDLVSHGTTILLTTQYLDEADRLADRIGIMNHGRKVAEGSPDQLKDRIGTSALAITPANRADVPAIRDAITRVLSPGGTPTTRAGRIYAPIRQTADATEILVALREQGLSPAAISVDRPSLDSVFLTLTGNHGPTREATDRSTTSGPTTSGPTTAGPTTAEPVHAAGLSTHHNTNLNNTDLNTEEDL
ncbi:ABC-2 type transport system ATP-binding protein [Actinomyces ruminicola]|uniref:ABC-2 type transport system ATP-binding protein n=1 Tax=Actinomyces ruminicola TaxID=332524 RepID=A0A1H0A559_9ACTO|nr:ATP-binding cassette domain-containing protein [Actinomyces ruminicola]SDN28391.1 ABC-2 type transport system ATP-binding protein [Actinomyces ruminicola]